MAATRRISTSPRHRRALLPLLAALLPFLVPPTALRAADRATADEGQPRLVILVRHAEKAAEPPKNPPLTRAGEERAQALALALKDAGVTAIVTSDARRTRATAAPLARERRLTPTIVGLGSGGLADHVAAVAAEVRRHAGGVVLVVGHSDTIPSIIAALGGPRLRDIHHIEFGHLFLLVPEAGGGARLVQAAYGAPDAR
jgi:broad specificity phosphatase PhoE